MHEHGSHEADVDLSLKQPIDPVCGMTVDPGARPDLHLELDGRTFWFCGKGCLLEFRDNPATYLNPSYIPGGM
jgi:YHS domain-containing protein